MTTTQKEQTPLISVLIPALNEEKNIGSCIKSIRSSFGEDYSYEIIVGDHGSKDDTVAIAASLGAKISRKLGGTVGALRNCIAARAKGQVFVFLDSDVTVDIQWWAHLSPKIEQLLSNPYQIIGSFCTTPETENWILKYWFAKTTHKNSSYLGTAHLICNKQLFHQIGGFDSSLSSGEDFDFCERARKENAIIHHCPELRVIHHDYPSSLAEFIRREAWHGSGDFQTIKRIRDSKVAIVTVIFFFCHLAILIPSDCVLGLNSVALFTLAAIIMISSIKKFEQLTPAERAINILLFYCYFLGRTIGLILTRFGRYK